jgi:mannose-1-phosphate guanylyltransferase/mannose-1-phosphate guanylyltransferase/mannose-6-phosphate isomerase
MAAKIYPVILSGGSGTRLWPKSRTSYPKQFLPLVSEQSLLQETVQRISNPSTFTAPLIMCNQEHRFVVAEQLRQICIQPSHIVLEPIARNTAAAAAAAACLLVADDPEAIMLILPSDHRVDNTEAFHSAIKTAAAAANEGALVTFGIKPTLAETGYGYILGGEPLGTIDGCLTVESFVEKPDLATAEAYLKDEAYFWNSGMFLFKASVFLTELEKFESNIIKGAKTALIEAHKDLDFLRLAIDPFLATPSKSIDYAVMERTSRAVVIPTDIGWNDVGSWASLWETGEKNADGNVMKGDSIALDTTNSFISSDGPLVTVLGVEDMTVVATKDAVLVSPLNRAQDVKAITDALKAENREEVSTYPIEYRPWGFYETMHVGEQYKVKRINVNAGASLSLQRHHHRAEHWIIVSGMAEVTKDDEIFHLNKNESVYLPQRCIHRLTNRGKNPLHLIEVQSGEYLGEDDIERFDDIYRRV